jgi:uncharacterized C2H2 Zn-finger protein
VSTAIVTVTKTGMWQTLFLTVTHYIRHVMSRLWSINRESRRAIKMTKSRVSHLVDGKCEQCGEPAASDDFITYVRTEDPDEAVDFVYVHLRCTEEVLGYDSREWH